MMEPAKRNVFRGRLCIDMDNEVKGEPVAVILA